MWQGCECVVPWVELVQCKTGKRGMTPAERWALTEIARQTGCTPVEARPGVNGRGVRFRVLEREQVSRET
jgi:hypothetical protein